MSQNCNNSEQTDGTFPLNGLQQEQALLETIFGSMAIGIEIYDLKGRLIDCNPYDLELFGVEHKDEFVNTHVTLFNNPNFALEQFDYLHKGQEIQISTTYDFDLVRQTHYYTTTKKGVIYLDIKITPIIKSESDEILGFVVTMNDVTRIRQRELELIRLNQQLGINNTKANLAIMASNILPWDYDVKKGVFITRHSDDPNKQRLLIMQDYIDATHPDDREKAAPCWEILRKGVNRSFKVDLRYKYKSQPQLGWQYGLIMGTPYEFDKEGNVLKFTGFSRNDTEQRRLNEELKWSVERARAAAEISNIVIWEYDVSNRTLLSYNDALLEVDADVPFTIDTVIRNLHPDDVDKLLYISRIFKERVSTQFAVDVRLRKTGEEHWHYTTISGKPLKLNSEGKVLLYAGTRVDNTKWNQINNELKEKNLQLDMALRAGRIVPVMWDVNSDIVHVAALEMKKEYDVFDKTNDGLPISVLLDNVHPDDRDKVKSIFTDIRSGKKNVVSEEFRYDVKHRYKEFFEANFIVAEDETGQHSSRVFGYMQDITERKHLLIDLQNAKELAEQSDKLKSAFLANMSHEIRTPLNAIVGFSDLLRESVDPEEKEEYMHIISVNNELLLRLIGDILDLSKIEAGIIERNPELIDMADLCKDVYTLIETRINNPKISFKMESPYPTCLVCVDSQRLKQVWINYLTNAIKHTKEGCIQMGYQHDGTFLRIYVKDTGSGISKELQKRVFGRFQKLNEFEQGTGLGLAISKAIIENVGGKVGFTSQEGVGSTFWATIPCEAKFR